MSHNELLIFDLDDTLIDTSDVYWRARSAFVEKVVREGIDEKIVIKEFEKVDSINMKKYGFDPTRYEKSMLDTYKNLLGIKEHELSDETISYIKSCGRLILEYPFKLIDGAKDILEWASKRYKVAVITRGEDFFKNRN